MEGKKQGQKAACGLEFKKAEATHRLAGTTSLLLLHLADELMKIIPSAESNVECCFAARYNFYGLILFFLSEEFSGRTGNGSALYASKVC